MSYAWIATYYGIMNSANISVPTDTKRKPEEITERLDFADVSVVFLSRRYSALKEVIPAKCGGVAHVLYLENISAEASNAPQMQTADIPRMHARCSV